MKFLVTNDDGINASGILELVVKLKKYSNDILVVAPSTEMSANSHKLTLKKGLKLEKVNDIVDGVSSYKVDGTPADCVKIAINYLNYKPDIVFSGINNGYNHGDDINYSGTVAAASEACLLGYKGIAVSCKMGTLDGVEYFDDIMEYLLNSDIYIKSNLININIPTNPQGIKITHQGRYPFEIKYIQKSDGLLYVKATPDPNRYFNDNDTDVVCVQENMVSISPLSFDKTDKELYQKIK